MAEPEPSGERRKVEVLLRVSRSLGLSIELDPLLRLIVSEVTAAMEAERTSLFLVDPADPQSLVGRVAEGLVAEEVRIRFGVGIAGTTAETRQTINIPDAYRDDRFNPLLDRSSNFVTRSVLSNPIIGQKGRLVGVVQVLNKKGGRAFDEEDEEILDALCVHLAIALERAELVESYLESQIVAKSLELARDIQMGLVPQQFPALPEVREVDIFAMMTPALQVGGDLYDYFLLDSSQICFIIGDVSEKGIPAAFFMATAHTAFKMAAIGSSWSIALTMRRVNEFLCSINPQQMFVTAFAGILDLRTGELEYADAGHEPPLVVEDAGTVRRVDKEGNVVLGFLRDNDFRSGTLRLAPGDALVLYTDGVSEAMDTQHRLFGIDGIERALTRAAAGSGSAELVMRLSADIGAFVGAAKQSDDITILVIRYLGPAGSEDVAVPSDKRAVDER